MCYVEFAHQVQHSNSLKVTLLQNVLPRRSIRIAGYEFRPFGTNLLPDIWHINDLMEIFRHLGLYFHGYSSFRGVL